MRGELGALALAKGLLPPESAQEEGEENKNTPNSFEGGGPRGAPLTRRCDFGPLHRERAVVARERLVEPTKGVSENLNLK